MKKKNTNRQPHARDRHGTTRDTRTSRHIEARAAIASCAPSSRCHTKYVRVYLTSAIKRITITFLSATICLLLHAQDDVQMRKLQMAAYAMTDLYVDHVPADSLVEAAVKAMLAELDPHSTYMDAEEVKQFNERMSGNFCGIGITFNILRDTLMVIQALPDSPAEQAGMMAGDRVVAVDSTTVAGRKLSNDAITSMIRGEAGTTVRLKVMRHGENEPLNMDVTRGKVDVKSVDAAVMLRPGVGYIRVLNFGATTADEFDKALSTLNRRKMHSLVVDLRGNGGGYLGSAVDMVSRFLGKGDMVVYTIGRDGKRRDIKARAGNKMQGLRLVMLVDDYTASAAEIFSGAVQDHDRGIVVGRRTFGKGLVQNVLDLPDGSMLRLTTSRYYLPSGRMIQKPYAGGVEAYAHEIDDRYRHGEMFSADSIDFPDSLRYKTLRLGRTVYGGGGVMPDIFVPLDTTRTNTLHRALLTKGCVARAALSYADGHRDGLAKEYRDAEDFAVRFDDSDGLMQSLLQEAQASDMTVDSLQLAAARPRLTMQLKGLVARDIWTVEAYVVVTATMDDTLQRALALLEDGTYERILALPPRRK